MLRKIGALVLAVVMLVGMTAAFALSTEDEGTGTSGTAITEVAITKEIVLFNTTTQPIYEPNITYTYELATQNPARATVTDKNLMSATVKTGVNGLVKIQGSDKTDYTGTAGITASLVFGDDDNTKKDTVAEGTTVTTANKKVANRNLKLVFDPTALKVGDDYPSSAAGIYRYKLTDTTASSALTAAGVARDDSYDPIRYLDVYVEWNAERTAPQVYGYVLYKTSDSSNTADGTTSIVYDEDETTAIKVTGYNVESEMLSTDGAANSTADEYHTYNLSVTKTTKGSMADLNNEFPVGIIFRNDSVHALADFYSTGDFENENLNLNASGGYTVNSDFTGQPSVKNGDTFTFVGLPVGTYYQIAEKNNTYDSYKVKIEDKTQATAATVFDEAIVAAGANTTVNERIAIDNASGSAFKTQDIQITNTLDAISPTGVVLRVAPYALMLGAGIILLLLSRKRKDKEEA